MATKITRTVTIKKSKVEVFEALSDFKKMAQFGSGVSEIKHIGGPKIGVGAKYHTRGKILGRSVEGDMQITAFNPSSAITIKGIFAHVPYEDRITLKSTGDSTELTLSDTSFPTGFFKTFDFIYRSMLTWYITRDLARIKKHLEQITS